LDPGHQLRTLAELTERIAKKRDRLEVRVTPQSFGIDHHPISSPFTPDQVFRVQIAMQEPRCGGGLHQFLQKRVVRLEKVLERQEPLRPIRQSPNDLRNSAPDLVVARFGLGQLEARPNSLHQDRSGLGVPRIDLGAEGIGERPSRMIARFELFAELRHSQNALQIGPDPTAMPPRKLLGGLKTVLRGPLRDSVRPANLGDFPFNLVQRKIRRNESGILFVRQEHEPLRLKSFEANQRRIAEMGRTVGIDLGTTNSVVAVMEAGEPVVITTAEGTRTMPSVVAFKANGERLVGATAKRQAVVNPENTVSSIKRFMGHRLSEVESEAKRTSYKVKAGKNGSVVAHIPALEKDFTPEEISAIILQKLKQDAEAYLGTTVDQAVITVPAYFNDSQRKATKDAGEIAGLKVLRIINEPTAASLAYGLDKKSNETILVFDLGGGTFDVSILDVGDGVFEVKSTSGDSHLGGDDFDAKIVEHLAAEFKKEQGIDLLQQKDALQRLRDAAEKAKIELSAQLSTQISLPYITAVENQPKHLDMTLSRAKFEELCQDLLDRIRKPFETALSDAKMTSGDLHEVILVGGSTRMPMVQDLVKKLTGKEPNRSVNPDEVVAVGAAIQAGILGGEVKDIVLLDVTPLSLGVETMGGVMDKVIERNTTIPTKKSRTYTTAADNQSEVEIHVLQGERPLAHQNKTLGRFHLTGIPPAPARVPQVEVTFDIDANGILNVSARDQATGNEQKITITGSGSLNRDEIDRMVKEAEANADADAQARDRIELKNKGEQLCFNVERSLRDAGDKVAEAERTEIEDKVRELRSALGTDDDDRIKTAMNELEQASYRLAETLYQQGQPADSTPAEEKVEAGVGASRQEDVIEAEFKEDK